MSNSQSRTSELDANYVAREKANGANVYADRDAAVMTGDEPEVESGAPSSLNGIAGAAARPAGEMQAEPAYGEASMEQEDQAQAHRAR